jgi:hypothetical protein
VLELAQLSASRVVTIDPNDPADAGGLLQAADGRREARCVGPGGWGAGGLAGA